MVITDLNDYYLAYYDKLMIVDSELEEKKAIFRISENQNDYPFGNVIRLRKLGNQENRAIWYSGSGSISILDTQEHTIIKRIENISDNLASEPVGFIDFLTPNTAVLMTYGREKKSLYFHSIDKDLRISAKFSYQNIFFGKKFQILKFLELLYSNHQFFCGDYSREHNLLVFGGKVQYRNIVDAPGDEA